METLLDSVDMCEQSALHYAAKSGSTDILTRLLELGASPSVKDEQDKTPIHLAAQ